MSWRPKLTGVVILVGFFSALAPDGSVEKQPPAERTARARPALFHEDPEHLWNRLHRHFTVRTTPSGQEHGFDALDPLLWPETEYLLTGESHRKALRLLDEFLRVGGEQLISDPLKRALLQRDLWAVFDWSAARKDNYPAARVAFRTKLAQVLWRLALQHEQVSALPDNYRQAVASGRYAAQYDSSQRERPFLPPDLFDPQGPWVALSSFLDPAAPTHLRVFSGRSVFLVFLRLPGGRKATLVYLAKLWHFPRPWPTETKLDTPLGRGFPLPLNPDVPQFPPGTQVALVRRLVLFDADGKLMDTAVTESAQIRVYREVPARVPFAFGAQDFFEFELSRALLLAREAGGLRPVTLDEAEFRIFGAHGWDVFEKHTESPHGAAALTCVNCHAEPGIHSLRTVRRLFPPQPLISDYVEGDPQFGPLDWEASATINWKENRYDWGLLNALRPLPNNPPNR